LFIIHLLWLAIVAQSRIADASGYVRCVTCELEKRHAKLYGNQDQGKHVAEGTCNLHQHRTDIQVPIEIIEDEIFCRPFAGMPPARCFGAAVATNDRLLQRCSDSILVI
jgi:hypothetical protein